MRHRRRYRAFALEFMRPKTSLLMTGGFFAGFGWAQSDAPNDQIKTLMARLDLRRRVQ
jgi:hypothetical protein